MSTSLDFSKGKEDRVSVEVSGWSPENKAAFTAQAQQLEGVTRVQSAGGSTSFYVYFNPVRMSEAELGIMLTDLARSLGGLDQGQSENRGHPANALTINGDPLTLNDDVLTLGDAAPISAQPGISTHSSDWTGIPSVPERVVIFKQLAPVALAAVDSLISQLEVAGDNGGPPLDERQEAIDALRELHSELGKLLAITDKAGFVGADGQGLAASCVHYAIRAAEKLRDDPIPVAVSGLVLTLCTALGAPGLGGWLGAVALLAQKTPEKR